MINDHKAPTFITNDDNEIKKIIEKGNYHTIVITSDYLSLPRFRNLGFNGNLLLEIQGLGSQEIAKAELQNAIPYITAYANGIISSITPHIMKLLDELYPDFPKFIFHNCFDIKQFSYKVFPKHPNPIIAWIGRIEDNKNWREFLQLGYYLIHVQNSNVQLYLFEDHTLAAPSEREAFQQLITLLNLQDHLTVYSNIPNDKMAEYFSIIGDSGGFLCSTSKVEGFGYAIVEAMACRCPVLSTDSDGVRNSIIHNQTGKYYTIGNIVEAADQANELLTNDKLRESLRTNTLSHITSLYSPDQYSAHFLNMIKELGAPDQ